MHPSLGIELGKHAAAETIQFTGGESTTASNVVWNQPQHMADASGVFQNTSAFKTQMPGNCPQSMLDDFAAGVMSIENAGFGAGPFIGRQQLLELVIMLAKALGPLLKRLVLKITA